ncbi:MAG TPA: DUF202 domain-containing protein [Polyangiales bacterium]|nr:DUF202 domain-containing protein [Polyangiales bacterium]
MLTSTHSDVSHAAVDAAAPAHHSASDELASRRTGMSFQRTRMSADRTLMSVIRTSLSLISFGFTIHQAFRHLQESGTLRSTEAPVRFGAALLLLGVTTLVLGIGYHLLFMRQLRVQREQMKADGLIHAESPYPVSMTLIIAVLLLGIGLLAFLSVAAHQGPFS